MSWASQRRATYTIGIIVFFAVIIGIPAVKYFSKAPTCFDGVQNHGETAIDKGGPCQILDGRTLNPASVLWARSFKVRNGLYSAVGYIENSNANAGVRTAQYHFGLYDSRNILVAERTGTTYIMPGTFTPVFEGNIDTGNRIVTHTYLELTDSSVWERLQNPAVAIRINNRTISNTTTMPRLEATAVNTSVAPVATPSFIAVVFTPGGTALAASKTALSRLDPGEQEQIVFTWPGPFPGQVGRIDIIPLLPPAPIKGM